MSKIHNQQQSRGNSSLQSQRIDKWLWAARFFKTRALASEAIKKGRVQIDGERIKPGKEIKPGVLLSIRQSYYERVVQVLSLSPRRGSATDAAQLYRETQESLANRERLREAQQAQPSIRRRGMGRPTKRERRQIISFTSKGKT